MSQEDTSSIQQIKTPREQIYDLAAHFGLVISFRSDWKIGQRDIEIPCSDGKTSFFRAEADFEQINDNTMIRINSKLVNTRMKFQP